MTGNTMAACFCIGPPGNCPCIRRQRESDWMNLQMRTQPLWTILQTLPAIPAEPRDPLKAMG